MRSNNNSPAYLHPEPELPPPEKFFGQKRCSVARFRKDMERTFALQPRRYPTLEIQLLYISAFLGGPAQLWFDTQTDNHSACMSSLPLFWEALSKRFSTTLITEQAASRLLRIRQRPTESLEDFNARFLNLAQAVPNYSDAPLRGIYLEAVQPEIMKQLIFLNPLPNTLDETMQACAMIDGRSRQFLQHNNYPTRIRTQEAGSRPDPVEHFRGPISAEEKDRRKRLNLCLFCGDNKHQIDACPKTRGPKRFEQSKNAKTRQ